jgi:hypothetical protein
MFDSFIGVAATSLGFITSVQEQLEYGLRITSLIIGIAVGLFSLYRIIRKL